MKDYLVFAIMQTEHYEWSAFGNSEEECRNAIFKEWNYGNGSEFRDKFKDANAMEDWYGIMYYNTKEMPIGTCKWT